MAKTDTAQEAATKAAAQRTIVPVYPTIRTWDASATQMVFFTANGVISCEATLYRENIGGDPDLRVEPARVVQRFALTDALPDELIAAAQLIQAYLHNHACELAGAVET